MLRLNKSFGPFASPQQGRCPDAHPNEVHPNNPDDAPNGKIPDDTATK